MCYISHYSIYQYIYSGVFSDVGSTLDQHYFSRSNQSSVVFDNLLLYVPSVWDQGFL